MYFSATIFALVGFRSPTLTSLCIATTNFLFTLLAFYYIDKVGRRRILLLSVPVMVFGLAICAVAFEFLDLPAEKASLSGFEGNTGATVWPVVLLVAMVTYVAGYAVGIGNIPWQQGEYVFPSFLPFSLSFHYFLNRQNYYPPKLTYPTRLFPLSVRSIGSGLSTTTNWTANFLISITFLPFMSLLTPVGTFCLYAFICLAAWGVAWGIYPETVGLGLEDVSELLKDGFNVKGSVARSRERRRIGQ
jgi:SP family myo-inositol transporter-like MFS transporter 13